MPPPSDVEAERPRALALGQSIARVRRAVGALAKHDKKAFHLQMLLNQNPVLSLTFEK